jgi:hypothetical protein
VVSLTSPLMLPIYPPTHSLTNAVHHGPRRTQIRLATTNTTLRPRTP